MLPGLRHIRIDRGLTQAQLARRAGVTANAISRYELGHDDPGLDVLDRLLAALECDYADLRGSASCRGGEANGLLAHGA